MTEWVEKAVTALGYWGVALLTFAENLFPPIPSEVIMPLAGFTASRGQLDVAMTIVAGSAGSLAGTALYYWAGLAIQEASLRRWIQEHGKWIAMGEDDLEKAIRWFDRHGRWALLICRFVPGLRTIISLPAGISRTSPVVFFAFSTVGVVIWTTALTYAGVALGKNYERVQNYTGPIAWGVTAVLAGALGWRWYRGRQADDGASSH